MSTEIMATLIAIGSTIATAGVGWILRRMAHKAARSAWAWAMVQFEGATATAVQPIVTSLRTDFATAQETNAEEHEAIRSQLAAGSERFGEVGERLSSLEGEVRGHILTTKNGHTPNPTVKGTPSDDPESTR